MVVTNNRAAQAERIVILGATSAMAQAWARIKAEQKSEFILLGRNAEKLNTLKLDLLVRGAQNVWVLQTDLANLNTLEGVLTKIEEHMAVWDTVLVAHGTLPEQAHCENNISLIAQALNENFISQALCIQWLAQKMRKQNSQEGDKIKQTILASPTGQALPLRQKSLVVITSVAADRGRQSNYVYGSAKAGLSTFLSGLRNSLYPDAINVLEVKPGFVDSPMTAHLPKNALFASPLTIALGIERALKRNETSVYLPWFWYGIMKIIKAIPEFIFMRLKL